MPQHFGELLRSLMGPRGFTQLSLATAVDVSEATIHRGATASECPWRRSTAIDVLRALDHAAPLTKAEASAYGEITGLAAFTQTIHRTERSAQVTEQRDPDILTAYSHLGALIEERGVKNIITLLENAAAAWNIDMPPRVTREDIASGKTWMYRGPVIKHPDGWSSQEFAPAKPTPTPTPPPSAAAKPSAKRR